ncbi:Transcription factor IIIA, partial [Spiromyces aspiralis]
ECGLKFAQLAQLQTHISEAHKPKSFTCPECSKTYCKLDVFRAHLETHNPNRPIIECPHEDCRKQYLSEKSLRNHLRTVHDQVKRFKCDEPGCGAVFPYKVNLARHQKLHDSAEQERRKKRKVEEEEAEARQRRRKENEVTDIEVLTGRDYDNDPNLALRTIPCIVTSCHLRFKRYYDRNRHMSVAHIDYRVPSNFPVPEGPDHLNRPAAQNAD